MTVLLTALAATIAMVALRQAVMVTRTESNRTDYARAYTQAQLVQAEFERELAEDPTFYLTRVFPYERPRRCTTPPPSPAPVFYDTQAQLGPEFPWVLPPANPREPSLGLSSEELKKHAGAWPAECGATWTYPAVGAATVGDHTYFRPVRAEVLPSATGVTLRVVARHGQAEAALRATYRVPAVSRFTLYSGTGLDLAALRLAAAAAPSDGLVYANGQIAATGGGQLDALTLLAEGGFTGHDDTTTAALLTGIPGQVETEVAPYVDDLRARVPVPRRFADLAAAAARLDARGCRGLTAAELVNYAAPHPAAGHSNQLCLAAGGPALPADTDTPVTFPADVAAWLLLPEGDRLRVYTAGTDPRPLAGCELVCDPTSAWATAATHPGRLPAAGGTWTYQGTYLLPDSGVVAADTDVYLSRCDEFDTSTSACGPHTYADGVAVPGGGVTTGETFTVVAGTGTDPADVWLQGPVRSNPDSLPVGVVATGALRIPYWARPAGADLTMELAAVALGMGASGGTAPVTATPTTTSADAGVLTWRGAVAAPSWADPATGFTALRLTRDDRLTDGAPPRFPGFDATPVREASQWVEPAEFCDGGTATGDCTELW